MQSMPLLFRQSLRASANLSRTPRPIRPPAFPRTAISPKTLLPPTTRAFSVCLQRQFRSNPATYASPNDPDHLKDKERPAEQSSQNAADTPWTDAIPKPDVLTGEQQPPPAAEKESLYRSTEEPGKTGSDRTHDGGLPSYMEDRRSQFAKQFSTMMDNLQSNVFVAGQRLNDLTGYSSIESLKRDIHTQEDRLRAARSHVRSAKDAYASAINRRSTSQREVNELLQRKHAWSPTDLERFTHLYRNDHTNEVAENEAQEALSAAERESEEAAAQLSKSILSRYHEEQVWSDKIRRMSTWGTWGLMGVNVLLFLIFQIAVEPWRRARLVRGFEEKVIEAIEKEKSFNNGNLLSPDDSHVPMDAHFSAPLEVTNSEEPFHTNGAPAATPAGSAPVSEAAATPAETPLPPADNYKDVLNNTVEHWRRVLHDCFSERSITITQRDLSTVALQGAAAGAAVMGLVIALIRPR
ncbi:putative mitochondrion biogenesis protein (She9) [Aspergillus candidus]|uniref:Sensitive to high expression protein 9, mitochondrial n=1 Tax=Aspergillus candidus TaxID=41067 RepID=A0A2I2F3I9_ASPCN|nr:hypothetical protein BDW47DRAFT_68076 [Aspergillus candidus]PLB35207.1 hypothetical protein BDW47DRAFT_68076 [Aspergillus candidus]